MLYTEKKDESIKIFRNAHTLNIYVIRCTNNENRNYKPKILQDPFL